VEESRPRRYYVLSAEGQQVLETMSHEWRELVRVMDHLLEGGNNGTD